MDEEVIDLIPEDELEVEDPDIITDEIELDDLEQGAEVDEPVVSVEIVPAEEIVIEVEESVGWSGGDNTRHYSLAGRDEANQHPITAITGLRDELDQIEALQPVYSNQIGSANYYKWHDGAYDEAGYFVSLVPNTSTITICDGTDIFGVTVDIAGFIGGQDGLTLDYVNGVVSAYGAARDNTYGLVSTSGLVEVRCESSVVEGDYVVSNAYGMATKAASGCGYKVVAIENKNGANYAVIALGVQACTIDVMGQQIQHLDERMSDATINIGAAMNLANEAFQKVSDSVNISEEALTEALRAMSKTEEMENIIAGTNAGLESASAAAAQSRAIAESAVTSAVSIKDEAVTRANDAWAKADKVETEMSSLCAQIDQYSVGEYSQAYGLTIEQARAILRTGMIYIPTKHGDVGTHTETYDGFGDVDFTNGFYYEWNGLYWSEKLGEVWFGTEQPAGTTYTYWYDGTRLFLLQDGEWSEVATLAGNVNNRITSMIRQDVDSVTAEVTNALGSVASLSARLDETDATVSSIAFWNKGDGKYNLAAVQQEASDDGANLALVVMGKDGDTVLNGASIVLSADASTSNILLDADQVTFTGLIDSANYAYTSGTYATSGTGIDLTNGNIISEKFSIIDGNVNLKGNVTATSGYIGIATQGWKIDENSLYHGSSFAKADMFLCTGSGAKFEIGTSGSISGWMLKAGENFGVTTSGALYCSDAHIEGEVAATSGYIGTKDTGWQINTDGIVISRQWTAHIDESNTSVEMSTGLFQTYDYLLPSLRTANTSAIRMCAGWETHDGTDIYKTKAPFVVLEDGSVYCAAIASIGYRDGSGIGDQQEESCRVTLRDGAIYIDHRDTSGVSSVPLVIFKTSDGWFTMCAKKSNNIWGLAVEPNDYEESV